MRRGKTLIKLFLIVCLVFICVNLETAFAEENNLNIYILEVGHGDCALLESNGEYLLIDSATIDYSDQIKEFLNSKGITKLDYVIATHPHIDHIGGFANIFGNYQIGKFYDNGLYYITNTYYNYNELLSKNNIIPIVPTVGLNGTSFKFGSAYVYFVAPNRTDITSYDRVNDTTLVVKIVNGNNKFLFAGDMESVSEEETIQVGYDLDVDVLKVSHHGLNTGTSDEFLKVTTPTLSLISGDSTTAKKEVIDRLQKYGNVYRTDLDGMLILHSDGEKISIENEANAYEISQNENLEISTLKNITFESSVEGISLVNPTEKLTYTNYINKKLTFKFNADYGIATGKSIEYMFVAKNENFNKDGKWTVGDTVTIDKSFVGSVYVKFTNSYGNEVIKKTTGFCLDLDEPTAIEIKSNNVNATLIDTTETTKYEVISNVGVTYKFNAYFGLSGKKNIEYVMIPTGDKLSEYDNEWVDYDNVTVEEQFKGVIYVKFTDNAGNSTIKKTNGIIVDYEDPSSCYVKSNIDSIKLVKTSAKNTYNIKSKKNITLTFGCDEFGLSGKGSIQYMLVESGKTFDENGIWTTGNKVTIKKNFKGRVYVKFTNKAGNSTILKTKGFNLKK